MVSLIFSFIILIIGYLVYGKIIESIFHPDERKTPAIAHNDGVVFVQIKTWKAFLIQLLNIAGTGQIFGALMGACFGPVVFLWIELGSILGGSVHDYMIGMISERNSGNSIAESGTALNVYGQAGVVYNISKGLLGTAGSILAIIGVVACPITSGDTALGVRDLY